MMLEQQTAGTVELNNGEAVQTIHGAEAGAAGQAGLLAAAAQALLREADQRQPRGFAGVVCPHCHEEGGVQISVGCLTDARCANCEEEIDLDAVRREIASWLPLLEYLAGAPLLPA